MHLEQFTSDFFPLVNKMARDVIRNYSGWFKDPKEELNDLVSVGMLELVNIFERVNFCDPGYRSFVAVRVHGCLVNYVYRNIPGIMPNAGSNLNNCEKVAGRKQFIRLDSIEEMIEMNCEPGDCLEIDELLFRNRVLEFITEFMEGLDPKERFMLIARFQDDRTFEQIGSVVHMQRGTVSEKIKGLTERLGKFLIRKYSLHLDPKDIVVYLKDTDLGVMILAVEENVPSVSGRRN